MRDTSSLLETLKKAAAALRDEGVPFAVAGGFATWARGGPASDHDIDLLLKEEDAERALGALERVGMRPERPPEGWLVKAVDGAVLVDLIHHPAGVPVTDEVLERGDVLQVDAMDMRVLPAGDVMVTKLLSLSEHHLQYEGILELARALREQIDWADVRKRTEHSPFARAFFFLGEDLGIVPPGDAPG